MEFLCCNEKAATDNTLTNECVWYGRSKKESGPNPWKLNVALWQRGDFVDVIKSRILK